jgi:hypothetical protein
MDKKIPEQVIKEAEFLINMYWENIKYIGTDEDAEYYQFVFPKNTSTGFPFVYIYHPKNGEVTEITGFDTFQIIKKFYKEENE